MCVIGMDSHIFTWKERSPVNLYITGFMGVGKSAVSKRLGAMLAMEAVDMDKVIAERQGMSISDIFSVYGEEYFRDQETKLLLELKQAGNMIVSCGGGAVLREKNVCHMKSGGPVILLTARPETVYNRVRYSSGRPVLEAKNRSEFIAGLMEKRKKIYEAAADLAVQTDDKTVVQVCEELVTKLMEMG